MPSTLRDWIENSQGLNQVFPGIKLSNPKDSIKYSHGLNQVIPGIKSSTPMDKIKCSQGFNQLLPRIGSYGLYTGIVLAPEYTEFDGIKLGHCC